MPRRSSKAGQHSGAGRPSRYKPEYAGLAAKLCELGATDEDIAEAFGVALRSIYRSIQRESPTDHVSPADLVAYHASGTHVSEDDRRAIEGHVRECHTCAVDLAVLDRAEASTRPRQVRPLLGAAASVLMVVAASWQTAAWLASSPAPQAVAHVVFSPVRRGTIEPNRLVGTGPWELEIWLPVHASAPDYRARIFRIDDSSTSIFAAPVAAGPQAGTVVLRVPCGLLQPGLHRLSLTPRDDGRSENNVYEFDVVSPK
jgi:hypothetical protein